MKLVVALALSVNAFTPSTPAAQKPREKPFLRRRRRRSYSDAREARRGRASYRARRLARRGRPRPTAFSRPPRPRTLLGHDAHAGGAGLLSDGAGPQAGALAAVRRNLGAAGASTRSRSTQSPNKGSRTLAAAPARRQGKRSYSSSYTSFDATRRHFPGGATSPAASRLALSTCLTNCCLHHRPRRRRRESPYTPGVGDTAISRGATRSRSRTAARRRPPKAAGADGRRTFGMFSDPATADDFVAKL